MKSRWKVKIYADKETFFFLIMGIDYVF